MLPHGGKPVLPHGGQPVLPHGGKPVLPHGGQPVLPHGGASVVPRGEASVPTRGEPDGRTDRAARARGAERVEPAAVSSTVALRREVGLGGAVLLGLGSIVGTGIFVSAAIATAVAGPAVLLSILLAGLVATCNALSSAQLAASHPVSGGTYEYGYRLLSPAAGFTAGWTFLWAKSASAATAALGFAGYVGASLDLARVWTLGLGLGATALLTAAVLGGIRRSDRTNAVIVSVTLLALGAFVVAGLPRAVAGAGAHFAGFWSGGGDGARSVLHGAALMFVAFTGYGRVATLGEEVRDPARTIPRAIGLTLVLSLALYLAVTFVAVGAVGAPAFGASARGVEAPLQVVSASFDAPLVPRLVTVGAITAMLGVLLNLVLGLSRVVLAMARRRDLPAGLAEIDGRSASPRRAVLLVGAVVAGLVLLGDPRTTWSFSAFTVLVYYALTNLAALRLHAEQRRYPRWIAVLGLAGCLGLAFRVEAPVWGSGLVLIAAGLAAHAVARARAGAGR